jgi:hypothetical protein
VKITTVRTINIPELLFFSITADVSPIYRIHMKIVLNSFSGSPGFIANDTMFSISKRS